MIKWIERCAARPWSLALGLPLLVSCAASVPLSRPLPAPVVVAVPAPIAPVPRASAAPVPLPPIPAAPPASVAPPIPAAPPASVAPPIPAASAPYAAAVAARFPEPAVAYHTPAFEPARTGFTSNAELQAALAALVREAGGSVRRIALGSSQSGAPIEALLFARHRDTVAEGVLLGGRPTVLLVGQQHGDEPAGAEALIVVARELAQGALAPLLERINVVVLPRANPDGAVAMRRFTASGIDANRDHLMLRTPEAQAQARLMREYQPLVVVDLHEYAVGAGFVERFGGVPRFDALLQYATAANLHGFITKAAEEWFRRPIVEALRAEGLSAEWYHTLAPDAADKKVAMGGVGPDTGRNVAGLRNMVSLLVESRGADLGRQHFARRVHTHVAALRAVLGSAAERSADLVKLRRFVDAEVSAQACQGQTVIEAAATPSEYELLLLDPVTGADKRVGVAWNSSLELRAVRSRARPCGYWLAATETEAVLRLRALGVRVQRLDEAGDLRGEAYTETARQLITRSAGPDGVADAGGVLNLKVGLLPALLDVAAGSHYVGLDQPLANLVIAALEPDTRASFAAHRIISSMNGLARVLERPQVRMTALP